MARERLAVEGNRPNQGSSKKENFFVGPVKVLRLMTTTAVRRSSAVIRVMIKTNKIIVK
jgi:hypothetical protein